MLADRVAAGSPGSQPLMPPSEGQEEHGSAALPQQAGAMQEYLYLLLFLNSTEYGQNAYRKYVLFTCISSGRNAVGRVSFMRF